MMGVDQFGKAFINDMRVDLCRRDVGVAKHGLDGA